MAKALAEALGTPDGERVLRERSVTPLGEAGPLVDDWRTYRDAGLLTHNRGVVIDLDDGSRWQITVVQERQGD